MPTGAEPATGALQVLDASAVVALLLDDGPDGRWVDECAAEGGLVAPHLMPFEAANIIRRTTARGAIDDTQGFQALGALFRLDVELVPLDSVGGRVWDLRRNLTVYDASYVAVAERLGARLVTLDARLAVAPGIDCDVIVAP
jgi:predicted nucleic acid-binding protein